MKVLKPMVFNRASGRLFLRFKKISGNTFPKDGLARELQPWVNDLIEVLTLYNVKINPC